MIWQNLIIFSGIACLLASMLGALIPEIPMNIAVFCYAVFIFSIFGMILT